MAVAVATAEEDETVDTEAGKVDTEEAEVDTEACLRDAKAAHPGNPNDELDAFLACVVSRLDRVSRGRESWRGRKPSLWSGPPIREF